MSPNPDNLESATPSALDSLNETQGYDLVGIIYFGEAAQLAACTPLVGLSMAPLKKSEPL